MYVHPLPGTYIDIIELVDWVRPLHVSKRAEPSGCRASQVHLACSFGT